jgi:hypothetical protein
LSFDDPVTLAPPRNAGAFCFRAASCDSFYRFKPAAEAELNSDLKSVKLHSQKLDAAASLREWGFAHSVRNSSVRVLFSMS